MAIETRKGKDGKPQYRVRIAGHDPVTGRRQNLTIGTYRTKREAEREERDALQHRDRGTLLNPATLTVGKLLDEWLTTKANEVSSQSLKDYEITIRLHLKPALGAVLVQKLNADRVQAQYDAWTAAGMSARQIRGCHLRLSQALDHAVKRNIIYVSVCSNVSPPRLSTKKADVWDTTEAMTFLEGAAKDSLSPLWHLLLLEGLRRGEALGLRWQDMNWERGTAHIVQTVAPDKSSRGEPIIQDRTKTKASARTVRLTPDTLALLKEHRKRWAERKVAAETWADHDLIVCTSKGTAVNPNNVTRSFDLIVKRAGLRRITPHGLRHTHATMLLKGGVSAKVVSERLGHASIAITLDTYSHVLPDMQDAAADAMSAIMAAAKVQA
jgi:integrase